MKTSFISHALVWVTFLALWFWMAQAISVNMNHSAMNHDPMEMSMADMWAMLEGKTWDALDKAFLEWMIPHHQWAIDMAKFLVDAKNPELKQMWVEIIAAQQAEIDQMNEWLIEWGYTN